MTTFTLVDRNEVLERILARAISRSNLTDLHDGAVGKQLAAGMAREVEDIYDQVALILSMIDPNKTEKEDLDALVQIFAPLGISPRRGAQKATTSERFTRTSGAAATYISIGTTVSAPGATPTADVEFELTAAVTIPAGAPPVAAFGMIQAKVAGSGGNVGAGTITKRVAVVTGLDAVTNLLAVTNGEDEESDADLRARLWSFLWSLPRNTPRALEYRAKTIGVSAHSDGVQGTPVDVFAMTTPTVRRCVFSSCYEDPAFPGVSTLYVDDGTGFSGRTIAQAWATVATQTVILGAVGGERRLNTAKWPILVTAPFLLERRIAGAGPWIAQVEGVNYTLNRSTGRITMAAPLTAGDNVRASYTYCLDLEWAVQYAIEGDPTDLETWPDWRPAGGVVFVRAATQFLLSVAADITFDPALTDFGTASAAVKTAILIYIQSLGIGQPFIRQEACERAMGVTGMVDINMTAPAANVPMAYHAKATSTTGDITIT